MHSILPHTDNPALRMQAAPIPHHDITSPRIRTLIAEMQKLLSKEDYGVALAAPQVGEPIQLFIVSGRALARNKRNAPDEPEDPKARSSKRAATLPDQVYINPVLVKMSRGKIGKHEGCLSIRGQWGIVPRAEKATIEAYDQNGVKFNRGASGFLAHIFQHEMDHLEGTLYIDKATEVYDDGDDEHPDA